MPVIKIMPSKSKTRILQKYIQNPNKTNESFYLENDCCAQTASKDFDLIRRLFRKREGRTHYHIIISWNSKEDDIPPEDCLEMTKEICDKTTISMYPYFAAIHTDTDHHHAHVVVNNVELKEGRSFQSTNAFRREIMRIANECAAERGYHNSIVTADQRSSIRRQTAELAVSIQKSKKPWKDTLRGFINEAMLKATSYEEFCEILSENSVDVQRDKNGEFKYLPYELYEDPDRMKPCHSRRLGTKYGKEQMEDAFHKNAVAKQKSEELKKVHEQHQKNTQSR